MGRGIHSIDRVVLIFAVRVAVVEAYRQAPFVRDKSPDLRRVRAFADGLTVLLPSVVTCDACVLV